MEVRDLRVQLKGRADVVDEISLEIRPGEVLGLVGESGSGKTTVGMALLGHVRRGGELGGGVILIDGQDLAGLGESGLRKLRGGTVAYIPQDPGTSLNPALRLRTQLAEVLEAHAGSWSADEREARMREALDEVALPSDDAFLARYPHQLSGGQQQRVAIAMAFACRPQVIVCDEPTTGLDVTTQARVLQTVRELCRSHRVAALYVSHDLAVVAELADRVAVMYAGRIVETGTRDELFYAARHPYTRRLLRAVPDLEGKRAVVGIPGHAPLPSNRPDGCFFHPRCPLATDECRREFPPAFAFGPGHLVRCYHADEAPRDLAVEGGAGAAAAAQAPEVVLSVRGLDGHHGARHTLFDVSLEVHRRECLALVGESGSGKTTLARCVAGLHKDFTGEVRLRDDVLPPAARRRTDAARKDIQYVFQNPYASLNPRRTVGQTIARQLELFGLGGGKEVSRRVSECLERVVALGHGGQPLPRRAVGRRAPARGHRPRPGGGARHDGVRRDHLGARRVRAGRHHRPAPRPAHGHGPLPALHHPQPRPHPHHRRPGGGDDGGAHRGDRADRDRARAPERALHPAAAGQHPEHRGHAGPGRRPRRLTAAPPNVLLLMGDQLAASWLPFGGHPVVQAPVLGALAREGVVFEQAYCASPLCAPSRAALLTGRLPSRTGVYDNAAEMRASEPTFVHHLRAAGYATCLSGKMHFVGPDQLHGFEERLTTDVYPADLDWTPDWRLPLTERLPWYHTMESVLTPGVCAASMQMDYDDLVAAQAVRKVRDLARDRSGRPFFLCVSFTHPHDPWELRPPYWERYDRDAIDLPAVGPIPRAEADPHSVRLRDMAGIDEAALGEAEIRAARHGYYAGISYLDERIGEVLAALHETGLAGDTIVLFCADHGEMLGERGLWYKMAFFDPAAARAAAGLGAGAAGGRARGGAGVPARPRADPARAVRAPGRGGARGGRGRAQPRAADGRRRGAADDVDVVAEYLAEGVTAPAVMIRRGRFKYIACAGDPEQLYDLEADPHELANLAGDPAHADVCAALRAEVARRWDLEALRETVLDSQRRRRVVVEALRQGQPERWDFLPRARRAFVRGSDDLYALQREARLDAPGWTTHDRLRRPQRLALGRGACAASATGLPRVPRAR